jgi:hypothetical protein
LLGVSFSCVDRYNCLDYLCTFLAAKKHLSDTASAGFLDFHYTPLVLYQQSPGMLQQQSEQKTRLE